MRIIGPPEEEGLRGYGQGRPIYTYLYLFIPKISLLPLSDQEEGLGQGQGQGWPGNWEVGRAFGVMDNDGLFIPIYT